MELKTELPLTLDDILFATCGVKHYRESRTINNIITNSKEAGIGDLFIPLKGERFDGEDYIYEAKKRGAYTISSQSRDADITVSDTAFAMLNIAKFYKEKHKRLKTTVAITGSVGKTTTKNILSQMLSKHFKVHATEGNYNNIIGVSYTLLTMPKDTEILVLEVGMNHFGEISTISEAVVPDISIITNIGSAHIGNFGSHELIAKAKLEIKDGMISDCLIIPNVPILKDRARDAITVAVNSPDADYSIFPLQARDDSTVFKAIYKEKILYATVNIPGMHILSSVIFGIVVMDILKLSEEMIIDSIASVTSDSVRQKMYRLKNVTIYDDTYNSSPEAVSSTFENIDLVWKGRKSCVLGDMLELGRFSEIFHKKIGADAVKFKYDKLFVFGVYAPFIAQGALEAGMNKNKIFINTDICSPAITAKQIKEYLNENELILFKASHSVHAERIISELELLLNKDRLLKRSGGVNNA